MYWKYTRTGIWIEHFDDSMALPMPYTLLHFFRSCVVVYKKLTKSIPSLGIGNTCEMTEIQKQKRLTYINLIKELIRRLEENENDRKSDPRVQSITNSDNDKMNLNRKSSLIQRHKDFKQLQEENDV